MDNDRITGIALGLILGFTFTILMLLIHRIDKNTIMLMMPQSTPELHATNSKAYVTEQPIQSKLTSQKTEKTHLIMSHPTTVKGTTRLVQLTGSGKIDELSIIIGSQNARIRIMVDGRLVINESIKDLKDLSMYSNWLGVQEINSETVIIITDVVYNNGFEAVLSTSQPTTVKLIGKYKEVI